MLLSLKLGFIKIYMDHIAILSDYVFISNSRKLAKGGEVGFYVKRCHKFTVIDEMTSSSSSFEGYPLQARHKQDWGRGFIFLLPQTAALPGSDAGSDVIKPALSFVIQNRQTSCSM